VVLLLELPGEQVNASLQRAAGLLHRTQALRHLVAGGRGGAEVVFQPRQFAFNGLELVGTGPGVGRTLGAPPETDQSKDRDAGGQAGSGHRTRTPGSRGEARVVPSGESGEAGQSIRVPAPGREPAFFVGGRVGRTSRSLSELRRPESR